MHNDNQISIALTYETFGNELKLYADIIFSCQKLGITKMMKKGMLTKCFPILKILYVFINIDLAASERIEVIVRTVVMPNG